MKFYFRKHLALLVFPFFGFINASDIPPVPDIVNSASEQAINFLNQKLQADGVSSRFRNEGGNLIYSGTFVPQWVNDLILKQLDLDTSHGTCGISPFTIYSVDEMKKSAWFRYLYVHKGYVWRKQVQGSGIGYDLLKELREKLGRNAFKEIQEWLGRQGEEERKLALERKKRKDFWKNFFSNVVPNMLSKKVLLLSTLLVLISMGIPFCLWHFSKAISNWLFRKMPVIIGPNDSNVYARGFLRRLLYRWPRLPNLVVPPSLESQLNKMIKKDKAVTTHNKNKKNKLKKKYRHCLSYGEAGVGKTLFAKKYAKKAGMNFIYFSIADLCKMGEEDAIQELGNIIAYAYRIWPCVLIIDEADRLFAKGDIKVSKMHTLFQKEFSKGVNTKIKIFYITNYPNKFPSTMMGRIGEVFFFPKPDFPTQKKLFFEHLKLALGSKFDWEGIVSNLSESDCEGLVGRDIEIVCSSFALEEEKTYEVLKFLIEDYKRRKNAMRNFSMPDEEEEIVSAPKKKKKYLFRL